MKIFLSGQSSYLDLDWSKCKYNLESFYYFKKEQEQYLKKWDMFMLDSGAFTFMGKSKSVDWKEYVKKYSEFITKNNIDLFLELDIDSIVGYKETAKLRDYLEELTGKRCIPVWHKSRGIEEYKRLISDYNYVAIGGIANKEIKPSEYNFFNKMIEMAHENECKVHGLEFTKTKLLKTYHFDSVDSTTWNRGRFGDLYVYDNGRMIVYNPKKKRLSDGRKANAFCLGEWCKFQKYAETHL